MQFPAIRAAFAALALGTALAASPVIGAGGFTPFGSNPAQDGAPFWDNVSSDGSGCGVGYVLTRNASINNCANKRMGTTSGLGLDANNLEYYSLLDHAVAFTLAAGDYEFALHAGLYGARINQVGYRYLSGSADTLMFQTSNLAGDTFTLHAASEFSLWIASDENPAYLFRSNDASGVRAAAIHDTASGLYYFGFEDRPTGDRDYNDMVLSASYEPVPEPSTYALIGFGLIAVALIGRKRPAR